jgi:hypothetical protein
MTKHFLYKLIDEWEIPRGIIQDELLTIETLVKFRKVIDSDLCSTSKESKFNDEELFFSSNARILKEKVVRRFQRDGIKYKEVGLNLEDEGTIYLTSNKLYFQSRNLTEYELKRIGDVTLSIEDWTILISLKNRKTPIIFSVEEIAELGGKLKKLTDEN